MEFALGGNAHAAYQAFLRHGALFPAQLATLLQLSAFAGGRRAGRTGRGRAGHQRRLPGPAHSARGQEPRGRPLCQPARRLVHACQAGTGHGNSAGRWTLLRSPLTPPCPSDERTAHWCRLLLRRYGVMFRDLLANESAAPSWGSLVRTYRRLEARGEVRGGRFVAGVAGEQYALTEVIPALRLAAPLATPFAEERPLILPATDPLNFTGRVGSESRVPALPGRTISHR